MQVRVSLEEPNYFYPNDSPRLVDAIRFSAPAVAPPDIPNSAIHFQAIYALVELKASDALPRLHQSLDDNAKSPFDKLESVTEAAQAAITKLQSETGR